MDHAERRNAKTAAVVHNAAKQRFEMDVEGQLSVLGYTFKNHRLFLTLQKFRRLFRTRAGYETSSCGIGVCATERIDGRCDLPFC